MRKLTVAGTALASIAGTAGLLFMAPTGVQAQVPGASASTTTAPTATTSPTSDDPAGHPGRDGDRPDGPGHGPFGGLSAAAKALGLTDAQLRQQLDAGKTIADVAKAKGISVDTVVKALVADAKTRLAQAVTAGKLTQAQADTMSADLTTRMTDLVNGKRPAFPGDEPGDGRGPFGGLSAAAKALGLTDAQLRQQLDAGKTIADVAKAKGISVDTVVKALVADAKTRLAQAVTAGKLTQARADTISADLTTRITDLVNGKRPAFPGGGPGRGWDHPAGAGAPGTSGN